MALVPGRFDGRPLRREAFLWSDSPTARPIRITRTAIPPRPPGTRI